MNISEFYRVNACDYGMYDNIRKLSCCIDGLKPSSRKCLYTVLKNNISTPLKVSQLMSKTSEQTNYLHGEQSLYGVIVGLAQDFTGSNNIALFQREGSFGNRLINDAAASRYIFTCKEKYLENIFLTDDNNILVEQFFEGDKIEPQFYVPVIPMLLVNGANGLTTGFRQIILPRNPKELIEWIKCKLNKTKFTGSLLPFYKGFTGKVIQDKTQTNKYYIIGKYSVQQGRKGSQPYIEISELPIGYDLKTYTKFLDKLIDDKKIDDYDDLSENGIFKFIVKFPKSGGYNATDKDLVDKLGLIKSFSEQYTSLDENMKVVEYNSIEEILEHYFEVRYDYYIKRKDDKLVDLFNQIKIAAAKYTFIKGIIDGDIIVNKKSINEIEQQLINIKNIIKIDDSYNYLLNMSVHSFTKEKYQKLYDDIKELSAKYKELKEMTIEQIWLKDLEKINEILNF